MTRWNQIGDTRGLWPNHTKPYQTRAIVYLCLSCGKHWQTTISEYMWILRNYWKTLNHHLPSALSSLERCSKFSTCCCWSFRSQMKLICWCWDPGNIMGSYGIYWKLLEYDGIIWNPQPGGVQGYLQYFTIISSGNPQILESWLNMMGFGSIQPDFICKYAESYGNIQEWCWTSNPLADLCGIVWALLDLNHQKPPKDPSRYAKYIQISWGWMPNWMSVGMSDRIIHHYIIIVG